MATAAKNTDAQHKRASVEEIFFQNDGVSLCLLVNRRAKTMRVVDFRAGASPKKQALVHSLAQREGVEKMYTLVERDEVSTWVKLGFAKEGNIPCFYKRSDAFLLGSTVDASMSLVPQREALHRSEVRIAVRDRLLDPPIIDLDESDEDADDEPLDTAAHDFAEKTLARAKKLAKDIAQKEQLEKRLLPIAKIAALRESDVKKPVAAAIRTGRALTAFEPFGRDVARAYYSVTCRGGFELIVSIESQECFGNAFLELLTGPKSDGDRLATVSALRALCDKMIADHLVSVFSLCPSDDVALAAAFAFNGFRRTGLLHKHVVLGGERKDAIIFSRKLANPAE